MDKKIPDRRAMEKTMSDIVRLLKSKTFNSTKEMDKYMKEIIENGEIPMTSHNSDLQVAQDIMYDAWGTDSKKERVRLANKALSICPDCADAYVLLAEETAKSLEEVKKLYQKGVEAGERALGEDTFKEYVGHFWGEIETRPYMRARVV